MITVDDCLGEKLSRVLIKRADEFAAPENYVLADEIVFLLESKCIRIVPLPDTDELIAEYLDSSKAEEIAHSDTISIQYIGRKLSAIWNCVTGSGYSDMFVLGFENLHPSLLVLSEGSASKLFEAKQVKLAAEEPAVQ